MPRPVKKVKVDTSKPAFTYNETCLLLNVSRNTLGALIASERLYAVKAGAKYIIPSWAVDEFLGKPTQVAK